ncbi:hypothetical protein ABW19_dt0202981 [Dactylella cylindrospora]|nr:hypothetical protein ABW19_dt0202981 [Dactylella cylindrospora]
MPEIAEVARIVHYIKQFLTGRTIKNVIANEDTIVFKDTTHTAFMKAMTGKKVVGAGQQGKYFWMIMDSPPHPLMHFGMTGWITFSQSPEAHYRADMDDAAKQEVEWPPRFAKFLLQTDDEENKVAFTDPRRLGRIRLIDSPADEIRKMSPLKENGPDPVVDGFEEEWFRQALLKRKVPVKALLLDQAFISGVGNWVGDEILYHARIHPEQYSNTLSEAQQKQLYESTMYVCKTACDVLGESSKFPPEWLMKHRWGKGKKGNFLPNGEKIDFVKVGGRTSAYVKSRQKATGGTSVKVKDEEEDDSGEEKKSAKKRKAIKNEDEDETPVKKGKRGSKAVRAEESEEEVKVPVKRGRKSTKVEESGEEFVEPKSSKRGKSSKKKENEIVINGKDEPETPSGRRSARFKK